MKTRLLFLGLVIVFISLNPNRNFAGSACVENLAFRFYKFGEKPTGGRVKISPAAAAFLSLLKATPAEERENLLRRTKQNSNITQWKELEWVISITNGFEHLKPLLIGLRSS